MPFLDRKFNSFFLHRFLKFAFDILLGPRYKKFEHSEWLVQHDIEFSFCRPCNNHPPYHFAIFLTSPSMVEALSTNLESYLSNFTALFTPNLILKSFEIFERIRTQPAPSSRVASPPTIQHCHFAIHPTIHQVILPSMQQSFTMPFCCLCNNHLSCHFAIYATINHCHMSLFHPCNNHQVMQPSNNHSPCHFDVHFAIHATIDHCHLAVHATIQHCHFAIYATIFVHFFEKCTYCLISAAG